MQRRGILVGLIGLGLGAGGTQVQAQAPAPAPAPAPAARAAPAPTAAVIAPPPGWTFDAQLSARLTVPKRAGMTAATMQAYRPAATGAVLYVTRLELKGAAERRDAIASAEIHELQAAMRRQGANATADASAQRTDGAARQLEAMLTWRDASAGVVDQSRTLVAADAERVVAVTGQCVLAADAEPALAKACEGALATLDPGIAAAARAPLSLVTDDAAGAPAMSDPEADNAAAGSGASAEPGAAPAGPAGPAGRAGPAGSAASEPGAPASGDAPSMGPPRGDERMLEDRRILSQPGAPKPQSDQRPIYLGLGLIVLAALFWWNRQRRERFEADDEDGERDGAARRPRRRRARDTGDDADDAADLHAAATAAPDASSPPEPQPVKPAKQPAKPEKEPDV